MLISKRQNYTKEELDKDFKDYESEMSAGRPRVWEGVVVGDALQPV